MKTSHIKNHIATDIKQGTLLCSTPINPNADNYKSLVLITRHSVLGSTGIVLNHPLGIKIHVNNLISGTEILELHHGGQIDEGLSFLVSMPSFRNGWKDSIYWSSNFNDLNVLLSYLQTKNISMSAYCGCMRWLPGELNMQVANKFWWATDDYSVNEIENGNANSWSTIAKKTAGHFAPLVDIEEPIILN